jgi:hypothetical protein
MKARLVVVPLLALAATLTACSADGPSDDPEKSATGFLDELNDGDAAKTCEYVATPAGDPVDDEDSEASCELSIDDLLNQAAEHSLDDWLDSDTEVKEDGDTATVTFTDVDGQVTLTKADGKWYVIETSLYSGVLAPDPL